MTISVPKARKLRREQEARDQAEDSEGEGQRPAREQHPPEPPARTGHQSFIETVAAPRRAPA